MSIPWAYCAQLPPIAPAVCRMDAEEARHLAGSRRLRSGDRLRLFDGRGRIADGSMGSSDRGGSVEVAVDALSTVPRAAPLIEVASAVPKGDRLAVLLEAIGPLAAARWTPLECARSIVHWSNAANPRAHRVLIASCKQAQQPWIPEVSEVRSPVAAARGAIDRGLRVVVAHPGGAVLESIRGDQAPTLLMVGPEGGFTPEEVAEVTALGAKEIALGDAILRIELAVTSALALLRVR